jgi:hypothetical protein
MIMRWAWRVISCLADIRRWFVMLSAYHLAPLSSNIQAAPMCEILAKRPILQSSAKFSTQRGCIFLVEYKLTVKCNSFELKGLWVYSPAFRCYSPPGVVDYWPHPLSCKTGERPQFPSRITLSGGIVLV